MDNILITGSNGQLGRALFDLKPQNPNFNFIGTDIDTLDICDSDKVEKLIMDFNPKIVVNCAAYTAVDLAEVEPRKAYNVNEGAAEILSKLAAKHNFLLIHISTDYVFDGKLPIPYNENNLPSPLSVYGASKLKGEEKVTHYSTSAYIIRTSWLYYHGGKNFVNTILHHAANKKPLTVVFDQTGSPTYARDLAVAIMAIISSGKKPQGTKIYHFANRGVASWFDFATAIVREAGEATNIDPVLTSTLNQKATRPSYSVLDCSKIEKDFKISIPYWLDSLKDYLDINKEAKYANI